MAIYTIIPDSTYTTGEMTTAAFEVPAGETSLKATVAVFTMGNDADLLRVVFEHSDDAATWQQKGSYEFARAVRGGGGSGPWMVQNQWYWDVKRYCRLRATVTGSGRYWAEFTVPAPLI
jgi:hypothetical protein